MPRMTMSKMIFGILKGQSTLNGDVAPPWGTNAMLLFRIIFVVLLTGLVGVVDRIFSGHWPNLVYVSAVSLLISYALTWIAGSASRGVALRKVVVGDIGDTLPDPQATIANAQKWYIESNSPERGLPHSCSFVEFDERGDYLDFHQHKHAYEKVLALAQKHEHLIVVMFLHGWQNNGQSGNVVDFNDFLHQLATHTDVKGPHHRVHGIYLSWRGACLKHAIDPRNQTFRQVAKRYGGDIVDLRQAARNDIWSQQAIDIRRALRYFPRPTRAETGRRKLRCRRSLLAGRHSYLRESLSKGEAAIVNAVRLIADRSYHFVIVVWRAKTAECVR